MEEEASTTNSETEIKMLQDCTGAIASINTHLKTVLGNLDQLSDSIQQLILPHELLCSRSNKLCEQWLEMWRKMESAEQPEQQL